MSIEPSVSTDEVARKTSWTTAPAGKTGCKRAGGARAQNTQRPVASGEGRRTEGRKGGPVTYTRPHASVHHASACAPSFILHFVLCISFDRMKEKRKLARRFG